MNKDIIISVTGIENDDDGDDKIEFVTEGKYYKRGGKHYFKYEESEMTGFDSHTTTTLKVDGDTVSMTRFGKVNTHMVFKTGEHHLGHYETPYGSFTIGILSDDVRVDIGEDKGDISIRYLLEIDNNTKAEHYLKVNMCNAAERN